MDKIKTNFNSLLYEIVKLNFNNYESRFQTTKYFKNHFIFYSFFEVIIFLNHFSYHHIFQLGIWSFPKKGLKKNSLEILIALIVSTLIEALCHLYVLFTPKRNSFERLSI